MMSVTPLDSVGREAEKNICGFLGNFSVYVQLQLVLDEITRIETELDRLQEESTKLAHKRLPLFGIALDGADRCPPSDKELSLAFRKIELCIELCDAQEALSVVADDRAKRYGIVA
jgi:hypothetical protein